MNKLRLSELNDKFIKDLEVNYIMECFKYSYVDTAGDESSILDINVDSPKKGLIAFNNNIREATTMTSMTFYYRNPQGELDVAFKVGQLSQLFDFNARVNNRLFIDLYDLTDNINCKFKFYNPTSFVVRQLHRYNLTPFSFDSTSTRFSDSLSFTKSAYNEKINQIPLELRNSIKIKPNSVIIDYQGNFHKNDGVDDINPLSVFDTKGLTKIPDMEYTRINQYNNEEYIIMSSFNIPILGKGIPELSYEDSRELFILLSTATEGGLNPSRELKAIKVDDFVNKFKNVITIWDNTQSYVVGDTVKSPLSHSVYKCVVNHKGQNPVFVNPNDGSIVNRDAGKYWIMYDNVPIGSEITLHVDNNSWGRIAWRYVDSYIFVGGYDYYNSFPNTWDYSIGLIGSSLELATVNINGTNEQRYRSKFNNDKGRYNRLIANGMGLDHRDHAIANNVKVKLPQLTGSFKVNVANNNGFKDTSGVFTGNGTHGGAHWNWGPRNAIIYNFDSHRSTNGDRSIGFVEGNTSNVTRGDEIDKRYLIKVR